MVFRLRIRSFLLLPAVSSTEEPVHAYQSQIVLLDKFGGIERPSLRKLFTSNIILCQIEVGRLAVQQ
jgi:hypothetical protein